MMLVLRVVAVVVMIMVMGFSMGFSMVMMVVIVMPMLRLVSERVAHPTRDLRDAFADRRGVLLARRIVRHRHHDAGRVNERDAHGRIPTHSRDDGVRERPRPGEAAEVHRG